MRSVLAEAALAVPESGAAAHPPIAERRGKGTASSPSSLSPSPCMAAPGFPPRHMGSLRQKNALIAKKQLSTRQNVHLWGLKMPKTPGEMGQVGHSEATQQHATPEKLLAPLRVNSCAADANTVLAISTCLAQTAKTAALI